MTGDGRGDAEIVARLGEVSQRIAAAAARSGRTAAAVTLVGATKGVEAARVAVAVHAGLRDVGENRAQDLLAKAPEVTAAVGSSPLRWHFLGTLQRNKVAALAPWITLWESVDRPALAGVIARHAPGARVLVEGRTFGFGRGRAGNIDTLMQLCRESGLSLIVVPFGVINSVT